MTENESWEDKERNCLNPGQRPTTYNERGEGAQGNSGGSVGERGRTAEEDARERPDGTTPGAEGGDPQGGEDPVAEGTSETSTAPAVGNASPVEQAPEACDPCLVPGCAEEAECGRVQRDASGLYSIPLAAEQKAQLEKCVGCSEGVLHPSLGGMCGDCPGVNAEAAPANAGATSVNAEAPSDAAEPAIKVYVASSWRCKHQPEAVRELRAAGFEVYDFRNPPGAGATGFSWAEVDPKWQAWTTYGFAQSLQHPRAQAGFWSDMNALMAADAVLLVRPCGASAHLEAGWAVGAGKRLVVWQPEHCEPELMYLMAGAGPQVVFEDLAAAINELRGAKRGPPRPITGWDVEAPGVDEKSPAAADLGHQQEAPAQRAALAQVDQPRPAAADLVHPRPVLRQWATGAEVTELQRLLAYHLPLGAAVDGEAPGGKGALFGPRTLRAVRIFQALAGLEPDGKVGPKTWAALAGPLPVPIRYTAEAVVHAALRQEGDRYVYGAEVRLDDPDPDAWDCAELVEWAVHQAGGKICDGSQLQRAACRRAGTMIPVELGLATRGALLFTDTHVAISLGNGWTIEARGKAWGVGIFRAVGRGWKEAARVPGLRYGPGGSDTGQAADEPADIPRAELNRLEDEYRGRARRARELARESEGGDSLPHLVLALLRAVSPAAAVEVRLGAATEPPDRALCQDLTAAIALELDDRRADA
jgi:cell wall-associated NlpC family hydrolase